MDAAARKLAKRLPDPFKAEQQLAALRDVRDNRVAASLLAALALGAKSEVGPTARFCLVQCGGGFDATREKRTNGPVACSGGHG
jgi:hypothetical protein